MFHMNVEWTPHPIILHYFLVLNIVCWLCLHFQIWLNLRVLLVLLHPQKENWSRTQRNLKNMITKRSDDVGYKNWAARRKRRSIVWWCVAELYLLDFTDGTCVMVKQNQTEVGKNREGKKRKENISFVLKACLFVITLESFIHYWLNFQKTVFKKKHHCSQVGKQIHLTSPYFVWSYQTMIYITISICTKICM